MDFRKAIEILSGKKSVEQNLSNGSSSITTRMITGEVVSKSEDGKVTVDIGGFSVPGDDDSYIVLDTVGGLEEGDTVNILLTGRDGYGLTPFAIGGTGTVDRLASRVTIAEEAGEIAKANNQHFWTDDNGAHVTDDTSDSWNTEYAKTNHGELSNPTDAKPWHNIILNALGILLRRGLLNLVSISKTAIAFYDGTGNSSDNITASFGGNGAIIGKTNDRHVVIGTDGLSVYNSDGTLAPVNSTFDGQNIDSASISGSKIDFSTFQNGSISGAAIDTSTFVDGTISGSAIDTSTFTNGSISGSAIDTSTFTNGSISGSKINASTFADGAISGSKINASTFADGAISGSKINASTFADGAISGSKIDSSTLTNIPYASIADADIAVASVANAQIANATINQAQVENLSSDYAHITNGAIDNAKISHADVNGLNANYAHITNGAIDNAKIGHADVNGLNANYAHITNGAIDNAKIGYADVNGLNANYAQIDMANVNNGWIQNGTIKNAAIKSQMVESISASQLTAGTIDADEITVQNLKASSLTVQTADGYVYVGEKRIPTKEFLDSLKDELQAEIDGAIETFTVSAIPTLNNTPANEWVVSGDAEATRKLRAKHVGDIAYVINEGSSANGHCYRFAYDNTTQTFGWVLIQDSDVTSALSRISNLETFESNTTSWIEETDEGLTTIRQNHTTLSGKVDKTVVETKQLWYTKSNTTAPTKPNSTTFPNGVTSTSTAGNAWTTVVPAYSASYPNYYYCLQYKLVDGTYAWSDVVRDIAMGESQQQGRKGVADAATAQTTANSNIKSSVQLWFTKANTTAPDKPTAEVTTNSASTVNAWNLAIPTYNSSYPNYFSCYQQQKGNGTWQWTDVVFDRSITEAQAKSQAALPSSEFTTFQSTTFKNLVDEVDEQSSTITQLSNSVSSVGNILTGNVANPSNWIISAPSGASYTKEAYGTAGVKVMFNAVSGWEWLYSQPIAVTSGNKYMVFFDYTVGKEYTTRSGSGGYGLAAYSGSTIPGSQVDDTNTRFLGKAIFPKTASGDRVLKGSFIFTATSDSIVLGLNGGHIADNQTGLSFTIDNLVVGETLSTTSNTVNSVKQTADANYQHLTNLTTTLGTNADGTSKSEDIVHKYNQLDQTLEGTISRVGETEASLITISNQNLSPYFSHPFDDFYNETDNPDGYWREDYTSYYWTELTDGWAHYTRTSGSSSTTWGNYYVNVIPDGLKPSTKYTFLVEWRNATIVGSSVFIAVVTDYNTLPDCFTGGTRHTGNITTSEGSKYIIVDTLSDLSQATIFSRGYVSCAANCSFDGDVRISVYEGEYDGPYKPYVDQSLITRMSSAETSIEQNATDITLRATKEESYQMGQPNLVPWFSAGVPQLPSTYWKYGAGSASSLPSSLQMTDMGDGWCHMVIDNTSGTGVVRYDYDPVAAEGIKLGKDYTFLFEFRNISQSTGANTQVYAVQAGTYGMQFWGNFAQKVLQGTALSCTTYLVQTIDQSGGSRADLCDDGVYRKRIVRKSEASDSTYWTRSNDKRCVRLVAYCDAGSIFDAEFRFSIYEGEYTGPYKPYSGTKLYASQAELKVANDRITSEVSARETLGQTVASHSTAIEQNASNITMSSKRMETIDGNMLYDVDAPSLAIVNGPSVRYFSDAGNSSFMVCDIREVTNAPTAGINYMAHWSVSGSSEGKVRGLCFYGQSHTQFISGQKYILSCWVRCTSGKFTYYNTSYSGSFPSNSGARTIDSSLDSNWQFVTTTVTATKTTLDRVYFSAKTLSDSLSFECDMCGFRLTAAAYATQAELKVANDNINLRVQKNDVINQINVSTEGATINANRVNIEGAAIFTSGRLSDSSLASVRLTLTRNNWSDSQWTTYETIGSNANWKNYHVAKGGSTSATGFSSNTLRVGDLVVVEGVSTDTGNTHRVTIKVTQVPSGAGSDIPATTVNAVNSNGIADNIQVGGRNLLPETQDWSGANKRTNGTYTVTSDTYGGCSIMTQVWGSGNCDLGYQNNVWTQPLEADTWYTLSFWAKASANIESWSYFFSPSTIDKGINSSGSIVTSADGQSRNTITTNWQRIWTSWHIKADATSFPQQMILTRLQSQHSGVTVYIAGAKLEKGNKPTDWSPAPEDVAADISAVSTVANNAAPKTNAVKRTQRIYYRSSSESKPTTMPSAWVTETGDKWSANNTTASNWTTKVTPISNGTGSSVTKYLYLWTCEQYELASGTVGYTNVLLDDSTTVINGGNIITGSVTANQLSANAVTAEKIAAGAITIGSVDGLQTVLDGKETAGLVGIRLTLTRDNWTDTDWVSREISGYTGSYTNAHTAKGGSTSATGFASNTLRVNDLVIIEGISTDTGNTHRFTIRVTSVPANATATIPGETVSSVNSVTMLDNINVGARNLLRWTNTQVDGDTWNKAADVSGTYGWYRYTSAITVSITNDGMKFTHSSASTRSGVVMYLSEPNAVVGEENVILSFDYRTNMTTLYSPYLLVAESGNSQHSTSMTCTKSETNWVHGSWKLNFPSTEGKTVVALLFGYVNTNGGWIEIKCGTLKLEKGSKETDWTPAIEDLTVLSEYNNLLLDTDTWGDKLWYDSAGAVINGDTVTYAANNTGNRMALIPCSSGQIFTLSYDIKASANITYGDSGGSVLVDFVSSTTTYNRVSYFTPAKNSSVETEWKRVAYTFAVPYVDTIKALTVGLRNMSPSASCTLYFRHVKLAIGDKTTEWSPANEQSVKRTQRIYYRSSSDTKPTDAATPTTWVTQNGNKWSATNTSLANWTTKVTPISDGTGSNVTKCLYLWTCQQFEFVDGTVSHSPVLLDDSTTVIDGAKIITGSVSANSLNADEVKAQIVQTTDLSADKIKSGDISADRIKANVISAINSLTAGTINGARINAEQIQIGGSSLATQSDINNIQVGGTNLLKKSHNINLCFNSTSKIASIEGGKSDPDGGSNAYLITPTSGQTSWYAGPASANCVLKNLEVSYAFSIWLRADTATQCKLCCRYMDSTPYSSTATRVVVDVTTAWQRFYISAPLKQAQATDSVWIGQVTDTPIYVYHPKVEVGTKPSDWSPAPEDVDASIDSVQSDLDMSRSWYAECPTAAGTTAKVATITPATTSFTTETLTPGTIVHVKFSATNSGSAGSLTLNVNGTGAKPIKYIASGGNVANIPDKGYLIANRTYEFYYDSTNWVVQMPYNTNNYDRENYKAAVVASAAISAGRIAVFGTDHKLKTLAASAFDVSCPILYVATAYSADDVTNATARSTNYTFWGSTFTLTNTHSIQGAAAGLPVFIVGTLSGTTFTPNSTVLTCTVPTSVNNLVYLRLGLMSTATTAVLESDHPMYMFFDGKFQQCDPATASAACSATNYISMSGSGIKIANANPSTATTYQLQTATGTDFVVAGSVMNRINGNGMTLYDGSGTDEDENVVAKFAGNLIELGKNRENTVIRCAENLELSYYHDNNGVRYGNLYSEAQIRMWSGYEDSSVPINQHAEVSAYAQQGEYQAMLKSVKMSQSDNASNKVASIASVVGDSGNSRIEARINDDPNDSNSSFIFDKNGLKLNDGPVLGSNGTGFTINGGTPIKAFYAGTDVFTLSNGQWMQLKSAAQVTTLLGSGASQANTICIAQNGDFDTYAGVVTGAMGQDGSARAYIYPNRSGGIRINYILIRFA